MYELKNLVFGVASSREIMEQSVVEICSIEKKGDGSLYDEKMGPLDNVQCKTCFTDSLNCAGHFGHVILIEPIPNPLFINQLLLYFSIFCFYCSNLLLEKLPQTCRQKRNEPLSSIVHTKSKNLICCKCLKEQPRIEIKHGLFFQQQTNKTSKTIIPIDMECVAKNYPNFKEPVIFENNMINSKYLILMLSSIKKQQLIDVDLYTPYALPQNLILSILPILPHLNRPFMVQPGQICDDDLTSLYLEVLKHQNKAKSCPDKYSPIYFKNIFKIAEQIQILFNNSNGIAKHPSSGRKYQGLSDRICGKNGLLRNNCMGKRVDQTARAVAAPGPELDCDQIGIPRAFAKILTRPIKCTIENLSEMQLLCNEGFVDRVDRFIDERKLEYGVAKFCAKQQTKLEFDDVLKKKDSMMHRIITGHEIIEPGDILIRKGKEIPTWATHSRIFKIEIGDIVHRYIQNGDVVLINRQPTLHTGSMAGMNVTIHDDYVIRLPLSITFRLNLDFDGDEINVHSLQTNESIQELHDKCHASKNIISPTNNKPFITFVQDTTIALWLMSSKSVIIDRDLISKRDYQHVVNVRKQLNIVQKRDTFALLSSFFPKNFVFRHAECQCVNGVWICGKIDKQISSHLIETIFFKYGSKITSYFVSKVQKVSVLWLSRRGFTISARDIASVDYSKQIHEMIKNGENGRTIRDTIHADLLRNYHGNFATCVESGAKGSHVNIGQMKAIIGQQQTSSGYIDANLSFGRVFAQDPIDDSNEKSTTNDLLKHGFIVESFTQGLGVRPYFCHAIPSRVAVIQTATGTPASGYMHHKIGKMVENVELIRNQIILHSTNAKTISLRYH